MVLQPEVRSPSPALHARQSPHDDAHRMDPVRIAGIAGALLLNGAALLLMLAPLSRPATEPNGPRGIEAEWFEPQPVPPPPPPELVPVQPVVTPPAPATTVRRAVVPDRAPIAPPVVDGGSLVADPAPPAVDPGSGEVAAAPSGPVSGVRLAYAEAGAPPYPRESLRSGHQGTVVLQVLVGIDGRPLEVSVETGSGYRQLDEAARRHVLRHWRFQPAMRDGQAVQAIGLVPIEFSLDRG